MSQGNRSDSIEGAIASAQTNAAEVSDRQDQARKIAEQIRLAEQDGQAPCGPPPILIRKDAKGATSIEAAPRSSNAVSPSAPVDDATAVAAEREHRVTHPGAVAKSREELIVIRQQIATQGTPEHKAA